MLGKGAIGAYLPERSREEMLGSDIPAQMRLEALGLDGDYIRGAGKSGLAYKAVLDARGHQKDDAEGWGKTPWHPTASDESKLAGKSGGHWGSMRDTEGMLRDVFTPSSIQLDSGNLSKLMEYYQRAEPDAILNTGMPIDMGEDAPIPSIKSKSKPKKGK